MEVKIFLVLLILRHIQKVLMVEMPAAGYLLFGWPGVLCGLCNTGDTTTSTKTTNICNDCGNRF